MSKEDGGPAFPSVRTEDWKEATWGMTLRDYFAAAALTGLLAHEQSGKESAQKVSAWSYEIADAMLEARK